MPTRKKYDWMSLRRNHKLKANTTDIRFDLITDLFIHLLCRLFRCFVKRIIDLFDQVNSIIFDSSLNIKFFLDLFSFSLLIPYFPFLFMKFLFFTLTHSIYIKKNYKTQNLFFLNTIIIYKSDLIMYKLMIFCISKTLILIIAYSFDFLLTLFNLEIKFSMSEQCIKVFIRIRPISQK